MAEGTPPNKADLKEEGNIQDSMACSLALSRKRKVLTLEERIQVIKLSNKGESSRKIAESMCVGKTQIQSILINKESLLKEWGIGRNSDKKYSKVRKTQYDDLNKLVWDWFCTARAKGVPISGRLLQSKALTFSLQLNHDDFMASNGWLESFKARHNIRFAALSGEAAEIHPTIEDDWKKRLDVLLEGYQLEDIFNADETGLFFGAMPNKSLVVEGDSCSGGEKSKDRLTLLLACSATGEKLKPLVIGHSKKPQCFRGKDLNSLQVIYRSNKKAWMTSELFCEWLDIVNNKMRLSNRHILMLVDNCATHPHVERSNVKLLFLPPNSTSKLQPCDGIIQAVKLHYRSKLLRRIAFAIDEVESASSLVKRVNLFDAIMWLKSAWDSLPQLIIQKCFTHCGIGASSSPEESDNPMVMETTEEMFPLLDGLTLQEFVEHDDDLATSRDVTTATDWEQQLVNRAQGKYVSDSGEEEPLTPIDETEEAQEPPAVTVQDAARMVEELRRFGLENDKPEIVEAMLQIEGVVQQIRFDKIKK